MLGLTTVNKGATGLSRWNKGPSYSFPTNHCSLGKKYHPLPSPQVSRRHLSQATIDPANTVLSADLTPHIPPRKFNALASKLREFFVKKGFVECYTQNRLSILAACEDPETISVFPYLKQKWPLPQTNQMWLEHLLLQEPSLPGLFCFTTSYRNEPNPIPGRHNVIFPMFEFEAPGKLEDLISLEQELLTFLGFKPKRWGEFSFPQLRYDAACEKFGVDIISAKEEAELCLSDDKYYPAVLLTHFPRRSHPFWNMKRDPVTGVANKVDLILCGHESVGGAERSCDPDLMRKDFLSISDGNYARLLFQQFGQQRVKKELDEYLSMRMFPRFGAGMGMTRVMRAMEIEGLL